MALLGVQVVLSMIMASFLSKISPQMSFARWLLCGKLRRYLTPTENDLKQAAGITSSQGKKFRKDQRNGQKKDSFTILKSTPIELESAPITSLDVVQLPYYLEYQWLIDYTVYAIIVYISTELYFAIWQPQNNYNLSILWCLLATAFTLKVMFTLTAMYFRIEDNSERILCIIFGFLFLIMAMGVLIVDEKVLEFGLIDGYSAFADGANKVLQENNIDSTGPATLLSIRIFLATVSAIVGAFLTFPGLRLARMHTGSLRYVGGNPFKIFMLYFNILSPLFVGLLWVKPIVKDYLIGRTYYGFTILSQAETFDTCRIVVLIVFCLFRFLCGWTHFQAHLNMAYEKVVALRKEAGRISAEDVQQMVSSVYLYLTIVVLQYLAPVILLLFLTFMLKTLGEYSFVDAFGIPLPTLAQNATKIARSKTTIDELSKVLPETAEEMLKDASSQVQEAVGNLHVIFSAACFRGLFSYFCWWVCVAWFTTSAFGLAYYSFLVEN